MNNPYIPRSNITIAASMVIVLAGVHAAQSIIVPFLLAGFVAILSYPLVKLLERIKIPEGISVLLAVATILLTGSVLGQFINRSIKNFATNMPEYKLKLIQHFENIPLLSEIEFFDKSLSETLTALEPEQAMSIGVNLLSNVGDILSSTFLILLAAIFILLEAKIFNSKIHTLSQGKSEFSEKVDNFISAVKNYMLIKTGISALTGVIISTALYFVGVEHFLLWGLLAFVLNYIPTLGSLLAAVPAICLAFVQFGSGTALLVAIIFIAANIIMGNIVEPKFMGSGLGLSTTVVFASLIFWGWLLGSVGMLLSIPLTMVIKIASSNSENWHWLAIILSDKASASVNFIKEKT
jgi:AI-2 transport protein TqsA